MGAGPTPTTPVSRAGFDTTDPEVANEALVRMFGDVRSRVFGDPHDFSYRLRSGAAAELAAAHMRFTMGIGMDAELQASHHTLLVMVAGDRYEVRSALGEVVLRPGDVAVVPAGAAVEVTLAGLEVVTLSLPAADLRRTATELYGDGAAEPGLLSMTPRSAPVGRYLRNLARVASSELLVEDSALQHPLVYQETLRGLSAAVLEAFPTSAGEARPRADDGHVAPRALRRAVQFIDANAARPVTLSEIAGAAGTSARAVQHAFARHLGTTPTAYVRRARLEQAHRELQAANPGDGVSVATTALRWGFRKPGRFASAYREVFGVNPSRTLRS